MSGRHQPKINKITERPGQTDKWALDDEGMAVRNLAATYQIQARRLGHAAGRLQAIGSQDQEQRRRNSESNANDCLNPVPIICFELAAARSACQDFCCKLDAKQLPYGNGIYVVETCETLLL